MGTLDDIRAVNAVFERGVADGDVASVVALYTSDAVVLAADTPIVEGPDAIRALFQGFIDAGAVSLALETTSFEEQGDVVIEVGRYTLGLRVEGADVSDVGKYLVVFARQADGSLRFKYDAFSSDGPA